MNTAANRLLKVCLVLCALLLLCTAGTALAARVEPLPAGPEDTDFSNGEFEVQITEKEADRTLGLKLYRTDRYDAEQIQQLEPGDTVVVNGREVTVLLVVIHGYYDEDGDGEEDGYSTTVRNAEQYADLLEQLEIEIGTEEIEPSAYEVIPADEDAYLYVVFRDSGEGYFTAEVEDWTPVTFVGETEAALPLPDNFVFYDYPGGDDPQEGTWEDLIEALRRSGPEYFSPYNTRIVLRDGLPAEVHNRSYPWGPEEGE